MGFVSLDQTIAAARELCFEGDKLRRTNGLWHVLMFLRHRACNSLNSEYRFDSFTLAEAAFDVLGIELPINDGSRCVYFEPAASQGKDPSKFFRHQNGPRQTFLNRIYSGLVGEGVKQLRLFVASSKSLPVRIQLADNWIQTLRGFAANSALLDDKTHDLVAWLFRFGIPTSGNNTVPLSENAGNGILSKRSNAEQLGLPSSTADLRLAISRFLGLNEGECLQLLPNLESVRLSDFSGDSPVDCATLGGEMRRSFDERAEACGEQTDEFCNSLDSMSSAFKAACDAVHLSISEEFPSRFISSLLAKRFLIITGLSGSGKTKCAQAFARWISSESSCYKLVAVGADWTNNEQILGYPDNLNGGYIQQEALKLLIRADQNRDKAHFLILDEMNLSHVERYFADLLSAIESGEPLALHGDEEPRAGVDGILHLPPNLFIIGTVNVDETTYMFSPKVLDRANVIEFRVSSAEIAGHLSDPQRIKLQSLAGLGLPFADAFVQCADPDKHDAKLDAETNRRFKAEMMLFFEVLAKHGAEFGYRTATETARFIHFHKLLSGDDWEFEDAMDAQIVQKLLPKLHGSRNKLAGLLWSLALLCSETRSLNVTDDGYEKNADYKALLARLDEAGKAEVEDYDPIFKESDLKERGETAYYRLSFTKLVRMWRNLEANGFVSFAEA